MKKRFKQTLILFMVLLCAVAFAGCNEEQSSFKVSTVSELNGNSIGIITSSVVDKIVAEQLPLSTVSYYSSVGDLGVALSERKIDALITDSGIASSFIKENEDFTYLNEPLGTIEYGAVFLKTEEGKKACDDFNDFIKQIADSGELSALQEKWIINNASEKVPYSELEGPNGSFSIAVDTSAYPYVYIYDNDLAGFEIELAYLYCKDRGYKLDIMTLDFSGMLAAASAGKVDAAMSSIIYTEERAEVFYFSELYAEANLLCCIRKENATSKYNNIEDLEGKNIAVVSGGIADQYTENAIDDVEISYFNSTSDMIEALISNKVDAFCTSASTLSTELQNRTDIKVIGNVGYEECGYLFPKTEAGELLRKELNEFMAESKENGLLDELDAKWHSDDESVKDIDYSVLTGENGILEYAVSSVVGEPAAYYKEDRIVGYDIDFIVQFAKAKGYGLHIVDYGFTGMLQAVAAGNCDLAGSNVTITAERKQSALFSDPLYRAEIVICVYNESEIAEDIGFIESIKNSFERTFIKENRYQLFINGILVTLKISFLAILFGVIFGFAVFGLRLVENKTLNFVLDKCSVIVGEMPTVVLLMIFYYVVFNGISISSSWVSIIAFTVYFGFAVAKALDTCLMSIDQGQFEAAYALGYKKFNVYRRVIVPQLVPQFIPLFINEVVGLIKATAIVGYIAVQDLTKVSDIIRSRTYEAFFPLIAITIVYFIVMKIFKELILFLGNRVNYANRDKKNILKGVKVRD